MSLFQPARVFRGCRYLPAYQGCGLIQSQAGHAVVRPRSIGSSLVRAIGMRVWPGGPIETCGWCSLFRPFRCPALAAAAWSRAFIEAGPLNLNESDGGAAFA